MWEMTQGRDFEAKIIFPVDPDVNERFPTDFLHGNTNFESFLPEILIF